MKYGLEKGTPFPSRFEILSENPRIKLRVDVEKIRLNPDLSEKGFEIDSRGCEILTLADMLASKE